MKLAADFRQLARDALKGKWGVAVLAGVLASICGAVSSGVPDIELDLESNSGGNLNIGGVPVVGPLGGVSEQFLDILIGGAIFIVAFALVAAAFSFVLGSIVGVGYSKFNLDLVDGREEPQIGTLFGYFKHWRTVIVANMWKALYIFLGMLLFIIPGIMATYSYAMTGYILAENPEMEPREALARSKEMMQGNRWRFFCLGFSFFGWSLLCVLTAGIGNLWLTPYEQAASAAFYREVSGTERMKTNSTFDEPEFL